MDRQWWDVHIAEVRRVFRGELATCSRACIRLGVPQVMDGMKPMDAFGNSGAGAIEFARLAGAARILMLGYDCQHTDGKRHWHGDHPQGTAGNAAPNTVAKWPVHFRRLQHRLGSIEVINCSRATALTVFPRAPLEEVLT